MVAAVPLTVAAGVYEVVVFYPQIGSGKMNASSLEMVSLIQHTHKQAKEI